MHPVPHQGEMERGQSGLGGLGWLVFISKIFFATAILFKYLAAGFFIRSQGHYQQVESQAQGTTSDSTSRTPDLEIFTDGFESSFNKLGGIRSPGTSGDHLLRSRGRLSGDHEHLHSGRGGGVRLGMDGAFSSDARDDGWGSSRIPQLKRDQSGHKKQLLGKIRKARHAAETENNLYEALATTHRTKRSRVDILETFAGRGMISKRASSFGLSACQPMDYNTGYDLATTDHQAHVRHCITHYKPLVLIEELHCTPWCLMQDNVNYRDQPEALQARRDAERPVLEEAMQWCRMQHAQGRYYLIENPLKSRLWKEPAVTSMLEDTNGCLATCHSGAYGGVNSRGQMIRSFQFGSNNKDILSYLVKKLSAEELEQCVPLEGKETTLSQEYPPDLVTSILKGIKYVARMRNPSRFQPKKVYAVFSQPSDDQQAWKEVIAQANRLFTSSSTSNIVLEKHDHLYGQIQALLPWEITRLQLAKRPLVQRLPMHVPRTHRGQVLKYTGREELDILSEDLSDVHFPRGRFEAPVEVAIFFFGYPRTADEDLGIPGIEAAELMQFKLAPILPKRSTTMRSPSQEPLE